MPMPPDPFVDESPKRSLLERLSSLLIREPEDRTELIDVLHNAYERQLLDADALSMIEGVLATSELAVRDVMVARSQMDMIEVGEAPEAFIPRVIETAHSRFPVFEGNRDTVLGILLAKDLLKYYAHAEAFNVRDLLRPATFIPESKRLNILLKDFRANRHHMAIVIDEFGGVAGLVTIEDVLEQIVGDIEDEYDEDENEDAILAERNGRFRVKAATAIEHFNGSFDVSLPLDEFDTIGGLVTDRFGHLPKRGERIDFDGLAFQVLRADSRRIHALLVERLPAAGAVPAPKIVPL
jgi:magnesium and cobalt transporter